MTIVEFLEARIAEDEAAIDRRGPYPHSWHGTDIAGSYSPQCPDCLGVQGRARVLAECAAKRAIIKQHEEWPVLVESKPRTEEVSSDLQGMAYRMTREIAWLTEREYVKRFGVEPPTTPMLRALAAVYKDHPDYDEDWAL
jgi:hypothetical protein